VCRSVLQCGFALCCLAPVDGVWREKVCAVVYVLVCIPVCCQCVAVCCRAVLLQLTTCGVKRCVCIY